MEGKLVALERRQTYRKVLGRRERLQLGCVCLQTEVLAFIRSLQAAILSWKWAVFEVGSLEKRKS